MWHCTIVVPTYSLQIKIEADKIIDNNMTILLRSLLACTKFSVLLTNLFKLKL